jgi:NAD-dependent deacetylase
MRYLGTVPQRSEKTLSGTTSGGISLIYHFPFLAADFSAQCYNGSKPGAKRIRVVTGAGVQLLKDKIQQCQDLAVLTGAGISAESGVPTFRGEGGLWRQYRAVDLATPQAFRQDPQLVWEFYQWRRRLLQPLKPNPAHAALVSLEQRLPKVTVITQNIDGLHALAGSRSLIELHGNIWYVRCTGCGQIREDRNLDLPPLPVCEQCGSLLRPHVVWFGERLDPAILTKTYEVLAMCQVLLVVGTSGLVQPAASMGAFAKEHNAFIGEINLETTPQSGIYDVSLQGKAGDLLPQLLQ